MTLLKNLRKLSQKTLIQVALIFGCNLVMIALPIYVYNDEVMTKEFPYFKDFVFYAFAACTYLGACIFDIEKLLKEG